MKQKMRHILALLLCAAITVGFFTGCRRGSKRTAKETEDTTYGIDVAKFQGTIRWEEVAASGVDFAMVRVGLRGMADGEISPDSNARYNLQEAAKYGVKLGVYFFSTAVSEEEAVEEADWVADFIAQYPITYPVVYDCEGFTDPDSRQYGLSKTERTNIALAFLEQIEKRGYEGMFYAAKNEIQDETHWETARIEKGYKIWVAQFPQNVNPAVQTSSYPGNHQMWQYTMDGSVPGINQPVDLNVAYFGYDGVEKPKNETAPEEAFPDVEALMDFTSVDEEVTAKVETNLRDIPSQDTDSTVMYTLKNGEVAIRISVSSSGWSKVLFNGNTYYAVTSYLTTDLNYTPPAAGEEDSDDNGIKTAFTPVNEEVTAKVVVNLRKLPSVEHEDATVVAQLKNGEIATCVGVSDNGWSKLLYNGVTCYAVTSYLTPADGSAAQTQPEGDGIQTQFEEMNDRVTAKVEVNLRSLPSVEDPDCVVVASLKNGEVVTRTGINRDVGWSRVDYNGQILYCVSSYLMAAE
ncbi:MAG: GH25 family lysozyme [Faecousia sp.]